ncbi:putative delta-60 repeat protein [Tahibacter aquaticus]|uniref:Putative delta-60 repeat protein n=1 Tax=Tahibacter aquaticus TaxID=520092 RepID=A0A4R6YIC7_9GAMM|nr:delta-60 repeat domain-containing protein [Tahibacter aquaticus]TDR36607.1 putative delta-60 repeat protein [Tahibacter aquaticus]
MRHAFLLAIAVLFGAVGHARAAEQVEPGFFFTSSGLVSFTAIALLPQPNGDQTLVFAWPFQSGVCNDVVCIGIDRWNASGARIGSTRLKSTALDTIAAATVDSRGRIIVVGRYQGAGSNGGEFGVVRFKADGSDDTSLAGDGNTYVDFGGGGSNFDNPLAVAVDADDNILVAGSAERASPGDSDFAVARLRASDGSLDTSFSSDGKNLVFFDLGPDSRLDQAYAVTVRNDGKIVLGGTALDSVIARRRPVMAQLNKDGSLDTGFCNTNCNFNAGYSGVNTGKRVYYFGTLTSHTDEILDVDVASNNDIVIAGATYAEDGSTRRAAIARFTGAGVQTSERLEVGFDSNARFTGVRFADGSGTRVIAVGDIGAGPNLFLAQRFTASLSPDTTYGYTFFCLPDASGLCFAGAGEFGDFGPNAAGKLHLDARGRPLFAGTFVRSSDSGRGSLVSVRISNISGPLPDRIFRNGLQ